MTNTPHKAASDAAGRPPGQAGQAEGKQRTAAGDPAQARTPAGESFQAERRTGRAAERAADRAARREARRQAAAGDTTPDDRSPSHGEPEEAPPPTLADMAAKLPPLPRPKLPKLPRLRRPRLRLLPAMMFAAVIMLGVRVGDVWDAMIAGPAGLALVEPSPARAEDGEPAPADGQAQPGQTGPETMDVAAAEDAATARPEDDAGDADAAGPGGPSLEPEEMTAGELELLQNLSERREALEEREQALDERAALLTVAERRIDEKMAELTALRAQLEGMMGMVDEEQEARLARLVSMYEAMRPTDAADIFNGLDMDVLIDVLQRMREQKSAPILAAMEPERARVVTAELVMRRELPELPTE